MILYHDIELISLFKLNLQEIIIEFELIQIDLWEFSLRNKMLDRKVILPHALFLFLTVFFFL
jgi:hypothetical protein